MIGGSIGTSKTSLGTIGHMLEVCTAFSFDLQSYYLNGTIGTRRQATTQATTQHSYGNSSC